MVASRVYNALGGRGCVACKRGVLGLGACGRVKIPPVCFYRGLFGADDLESGYVGVSVVDYDV